MMPIPVFLSKAHQKGFTMIEIMVALVILSIGLLGVAGVQALGLRTATVALNNNTATTLAVEITERMRVNQTAFLADAYVITLDASNPPGGSLCTSNCTTAQQAASDLINWYNRLMVLDQASASIARNNNTATVTINWNDIGIGFNNGSDESIQTFVYTAQLAN